MLAVLQLPTLGHRERPDCQIQLVVGLLRSPLQLDLSAPQSSLCEQRPTSMWKNVILYGEIKIDPAKLKMRGL